MPIPDDVFDVLDHAAIAVSRSRLTRDLSVERRLQRLVTRHHGPLSVDEGTTALLRRRLLGRGQRSPM